MEHYRSYQYTAIVHILIGHTYNKYLYFIPHPFSQLHLSPCTIKALTLFDPELWLMEVAYPNIPRQSFLSNIVVAGLARRVWVWLVSCSNKSAKMER